jgi:hypothetical protein
VTMRALRLEVGAWRALSLHLSPGAQVLLWAGAERPDLPPELVPARDLPLPGAEHRILREFRYSPGRAS